METLEPPDATPSDDSGQRAHPLATVARGRYLMPLVLVAGVVAMAVNESTYRHSRHTLSGGIALTDARVQAAGTLQLVTDAGLYARAYILSGSEEDALDYRRTVRAVQTVKQRTFDLVAEVDPQRQVSIDSIEQLVGEQLAITDRWVDLVAKGQVATARAEAIRRSSNARRDQLRIAFDDMLDRAATIQQTARFSLYQALDMSRIAVHLLSLMAMLGMFLFQRQLRRGDEQLAEEKRLLSSRVSERTAELSEMASHLVHAREDERAHIARELHDELGGLLTAMKLDFARLRRIPGLPDKSPERLAAIESRLNEGIALKRRIIESLRPSSLDQLGLVQSLEILCRDMAASLNRPVQTQFQPVEVDKDAELALYRIAQESLTNIGKYADCSRVQVGLETRDGHVRLTIQDDGKGFVPLRVAHGRHGLLGMRMRAESHGGRLQVRSAPNQGTTVTAIFPARSVDA